MRALILTLTFIISEYSIITGGDGNCGDLPKIENAVTPVINDKKLRMKCKEGYLRKAGTSDLFKCTNNKWENNLSLVCIPDPTLKRTSTTHRTPTVTTQSRTTSTLAVATLTDTPRLPVTPSWPDPTPKTHNMTTQPKTTSTLGHPAITPTHKTSTTSQTYCETSQMATTQEETSMTTTSKTSTHTASATTEKENLTTVSPHTRTSLSTRSPENPSKNPYFNIHSKGMTAGIVILVIIVILAATVAVLFWRPCARFRRASGPSVEMTIQNPGSDQPLIKTHPVTSSCPPDAIQSPVISFTDSPEITYSYTHLSA